MKHWRAVLKEAAHADRALVLALLVGVVLGGVLLWSHASERVRAFENALSGYVASRANALDMQMRVAIGHLEALRQRSEYFYAEYPAPADIPDSRLLSAFLSSNARGDKRISYSLDRLPPPYLVDQIGNLAALSMNDAARDQHLSRPDDAGWRQEAAMAVQLLPMMAVTQKVMPEARRLVYASLSGMVAVHPWVESRQIDLLAMTGTLGAFLNTVAATNPAGGPAWTLMGPEGELPQNAVLSMPVSLQGRYAGALAIDVPITGLRNILGGSPNNKAVLLLIDGKGNVITSSNQDRLPLPNNIVALLPNRDGTHRGTTGDGLLHNHVFVVPLKYAPWSVVYVAPPTASLLPIIADILISVLGFLGALLVVVFVARRLMLRALAIRDRAALAEREARDAAERALGDLRAAHDELDFLNREKTRFFSLISHDLRGPFNSMLGMTQELADHAPRMKPEDIADFAASVHEMARKVFELLENLLQWSRVQMSGTPFAPTVFPMREVVSDAIRDVASPAQSKEITILDAAGDRWVLADRTMILAVLRNLLMNAVKFSHQGGVVHVTSRAQGDRLEVAVTDKGVGMEPSQLDLALRGGPKASRPGTQGETGTGLGLTLVRDLILRHGGELTLESTQGRGTIASFTVPLSHDPAETRRLITRAAD